MNTNMDDSNDIKRSLLAWISTFSIDVNININIDDSDSVSQSFERLRDGSVLLSVFQKIVKVDNTNEMIGSNLKILLNQIIEYYEDPLGKHIDTSYIDIDAIAKGNNNTAYDDTVIKLIELILGVAVMCEDKAIYISKIFELDLTSQKVLKQLIEKVMAYVEPVDRYNSNNTTTTNNSKSNSNNDELVRANEMIKHLQEERQDLINRNHEYESMMSSLQDTNSSLSTQINKYEKEIETLHQSSTTSTAVSAANNAIATELEETSRQLDMKTVELEALKHDYDNEKKTIVMLKDIQARNESELQQLHDEIDLGRANSSKLIKVEVENEKLKKRLEEIIALKKDNQSLNRTLDEYLDKIKELEIASKSSGSLQKMVDQYKDKLIEGETKNFELISSNEMLRRELEQEKRGRLDERKRHNDDRLHLQAQVDQFQHLFAEKDEKAATGDGSSTTTTSDNSNSNSNSNSASSEEIEALKHELAKSKRVFHQQLESSRAESRRKVEELESEIEKLKESSSSSSSSSRSSVTGGGGVGGGLGLGLGLGVTSTKELEQKLSQYSNTIQLLENKLKEKEGSINKLEQEKAKLHSFFEQTFTNFKEKHLGMIYDLKALCKNEKRKNDDLREKYEKGREQQMREARLLSSSYFELGGMLFSRNIEMKVSEQQATYLSEIRGEFYTSRRDVERSVAR